MKMADKRSHNGVYNYPESFRQQILALDVKREFFVKYGNLIEPAYFPVEREQKFARVVGDHRKKYAGTCPTPADVILEMPDEEEFVRNIFTLSQNGLYKTCDEVRQWAQDQAVRIAYIESLEDHQSGNNRAIVQRFQTALRVGQDMLDLGADLEDMSWLVDSDYDDKVVSTPWREVNLQINGGLGEGELGVVMGLTGGYKSTSLINIGMHAAGIINAKNVIHFTMELHERMVRARYAHRLTFKSHKGQDPEEYRKELLDAMRVKLGGAIKVKQYPPNAVTVPELCEFVERVADNGFEPGLIIVDYPALMKSTRQYSQKRFELEEIHMDVRAMGVKFQVPVWSAAQAIRSKKGIITAEDVAEDYNISRIADVMISNNQDNDEIKENKLRLYMAKIREGGRKGRQVAAKIRYPGIISTGFVKDDEDEENAGEG